MAANDPRISVTPASEAQGYLLKLWAQLTGRTVSGLAGHLLETAITQAIRQGDVPPEALKGMGDYIEARGEFMAEDHQEFIAGVKEHG